MMFLLGSLEIGKISKEKRNKTNTNKQKPGAETRTVKDRKSSQCCPEANANSSLSSVLGTKAGWRPQPEIPGSKPGLQKGTKWLQAPVTTVSRTSKSRPF